MRGAAASHADRGIAMEHRQSMLNVNRSTFSDFSGAPDRANVSETSHLSPGFLASLLRKNSRMVGRAVGGAMALGLLYAWTSTPLYMATCQILIDARRAHADEAGGSNKSLAELGMDPASIDSQVAVLSSESAAVQTLKYLHLEKSNDFATPTTMPGRLLSAVAHLWRRTDPSDRSGVAPDVLEGFMKRLEVRRVPQTYVLLINFYDRTPERAATIANAIASVYSSTQADAHFETQRASVAWTKTRMEETRSEILAGEQILRSLKAEDVGQNSNGAQEKARGLERELEEKRRIFEALVTRANTVLQQQYLPVSPMSVIADARPPKRKSAPNTALILALSGLIGLAAALALLVYRAVFDTTFRTPSQVENELGLRVLGVVPQLDGRPARASRPFFVNAQASRAIRRVWRSLPRLLRVPGLRRVGLLRRQSATGGTLDRALCTVRGAADRFSHHDGFSVIGVVSATSGEGRSKVAASLGDEIALTGRRVLLIDADFGRPGLSEARAANCCCGMSDVLSGAAGLEEAIIAGAHGADFLPFFGARTPGRRSAQIDGESLRAVLTRINQHYEYVVMDLPPISALTEPAALASQMSAIVLVVAWGGVQRSLVVEALAAAPSVSERLVGAILNKIDVGALQQMVFEPGDVLFLDRLMRQTLYAHRGG
jgi:uncharacterized protein involved in exopolysaccharide biosynthesis/Mrp family chromosome partitioning ATPase